MSKRLWLGWAALLLAGCVETANSPAATSPAPAPAPAQMAAAPATASVLGGQRGEGKPYEIVDSQVWTVPDPATGRDYQVFVALPRGYADDPARRYPVLYVTDADYAFPLLRQIARRLNGEGPKIDDFILVGLSYAIGDDAMPSRRRDYTPTPEDGTNSPPTPTHGKASGYIGYLRDQVLPFVAQRYRTDERKRLFLGHSYGGLLGTQILLSTPQMFSGYILGSPSYWYGDHAMRDQETAFAATHQDLPAQVYLYVGEYEQTRYGQNYDMVDDAHAMLRSLRSRRYPGLQVQLEVLDGEDHLSVAPRGFTHGLKYLLGTKAPG